MWMDGLVGGMGIVWIRTEGGLVLTFTSLPDFVRDDYILSILDRKK
jgi:hypothetical protein